ncbi:hypothetical protein [Mycetocola saprophilus]|uniref:hypothetical protein n=1 Tax=Mycetocola saprophilus TaxID=76636 RepID=UPI0004C1A29A
MPANEAAGQYLNDQVNERLKSALGSARPLPIARLHFNRTQKYLGLVDADKNETRIPIEHPTEIYAHADALRETVRRYHEV